MRESVHRWASDKDELAERRTQNNMPANDRGCTKSIMVLSALMRSVDYRIPLNAEGLLDNQITISAILPGPTLSSAEWGEGRLSVKPDVQFSRGRFGVALPPPPPWGNGAGRGRTGPAELCNGGGDTLATRLQD